MRKVRRLLKENWIPIVVGICGGCRYRSGIVFFVIMGVNTGNAAFPDEKDEQCQQ